MRGLDFAWMVGGTLVELTDVDEAGIVDTRKQAKRGNSKSGITG